MKVGVLCEYSGVVRDAFAARGHDAVSCDLLPTDNPGPHIQGDCLEQDWSGFDLLICHPPCTYLCNSGVRWLREQDGRWEKMKQAALFFKAMFALPCDRIAVENPIMHKYAAEIVGGRQNQLIQPWMFGHGETKATCLWLKNLPLLQPTDVVQGREQRVHRLPPSKDRWKIRYTTYQGIADAMAEQWGENTPYISAQAPCTIT